MSKQNPEAHERKWIIIIIIIIIKTRKTLNRDSEKREGKRGLKGSKKVLEIILKLFAEIRRNFPYVSDYITVTHEVPASYKLLLKP